MAQTTPIPSPASLQRAFRIDPQHLDEKIADLMDNGMKQEETERTARRELGNVTQIDDFVSGDVEADH